MVHLRATYGPRSDRAGARMPGVLGMGYLGAVMGQKIGYREANKNNRKARFYAGLPVVLRKNKAMKKSICYPGTRSCADAGSISDNSWAVRGPCGDRKKWRDGWA